jgi:hypothetical protein
MGYQCFSQRLLNPFRGITNTICCQSAEAVTAALGIDRTRTSAVAD